MIFVAPCSKKIWIWLLSKLRLNTVAARKDHHLVYTSLLNRPPFRIEHTLKIEIRNRPTSVYSSSYRIQPTQDIVKHWNFAGPFFRLAPLRIIALLSPCAVVLVCSCLAWRWRAGLVTYLIRQHQRFFCWTLWPFRTYCGLEWPCGL